MAEMRALEADINDILSLYPKDSATGILHWIESGKLRYSDYKKNEGLLCGTMGLFQ